MHVVEEPFLTRESILLVLKPGEITTDRPFRTLRQRGGASNGISIPTRTPTGQLLGKVSLYCSLNGDAARAYRLDDFEMSHELVKRATKLERSPWAKLIQRAVEAIASAMPADPDSAEAPPGLRRYLGLRRRSSWRGLDQSALVREWLAHSSAWLDSGAIDREELRGAIEALDAECQKARAEILPDHARSVETFFGIVCRMDPSAAELESGSGETVLIPRDDLERQGLASLGQAVSLLREVMPGGGSYCLPMSAVALEEQSFSDSRSPWERRAHAEAILVSGVSERDSNWLDRELAREPTAVPAAPLRTN